MSEALDRAKLELAAARAAMDQYYAGLCHCGSPVAAVAEFGVYANVNMTHYFCGLCISVRCDAYPGACRQARSNAVPCCDGRLGDDCRCECHVRKSPGAGSDD